MATVYLEKMRTWGPRYGTLDLHHIFLLRPGGPDLRLPDESSDEGQPSNIPSSSGRGGEALINALCEFPFLSNSSL